MSQNESRPSGSIPIPKKERSSFVTEVRRELSKVDWPKPKETARMTGVVFAIVAIAGVSIYIMSLASNVLVHMIQGRGF
jgi:preprotein translocase SecE subunit